MSAKVFFTRNSFLIYPIAWVWGFAYRGVKDICFKFRLYWARNPHAEKAPTEYKGNFA